MKKMNDVSVATISWARNEQEEKVLESSLRYLADSRLPVYITDGGSSPRFLQFLHGFSNFTVLHAKGLWPQAKASIMCAAEKTEFVLYTEPDKPDFFSMYLPKMLQKEWDESMGVILASRSSKGFSTFPVFQQLTENTINQCCKEIIGKNIDYCYGPFLFNSRLMSFMDSIKDDCGWGWRPYLFTIAHRLTLTIHSYQDDFSCPPDQRIDNDAERIYRMKQLTQNLNGLIEASMVDLSRSK
jgi:hypothetical protein